MCTWSVASEMFTLAHTSNIRGFESHFSEFAVSRNMYIAQKTVLV